MDAKDDLARIGYDESIDQKRAAEIIKGILKELDKNSPNSIKEGEFPEFLDIQDHYEFDLILSTGWMKRIYFQRIAKFGMSKSIQSKEIVMK